ncbi:cold shock domain-containing protein [Streptomyces sp. NPDC049915]|uniref:cold shock domain-containing protein n=1 Tax=Streptomyces sp. NPDC049915 TaxID=3155510 RepID=UPI00342A2A4B
MTEAIVRVWHEEEGWGILDSKETPGGCWTHFSVIEMPGFRSLEGGQKVTLEWESGEQDGFQFRAIRVLPENSKSTS